MSVIQSYSNHRTIFVSDSGGCWTCHFYLQVRRLLWSGNSNIETENLFGAPLKDVSEFESESEFITL